MVGESIIYKFLRRKKARGGKKRKSGRETRGSIIGTRHDAALREQLFSKSRLDARQAV